jgi:hypothetical protein
MAGIPSAILACLVSLVMATLTPTTSLSDRWHSWVLEAPHDTGSGTSSHTLKLRTFHEMAMPVLKAEGFAMCISTRDDRLQTLARTLQAGLEPLATTTGRKSRQVSKPSENSTIQLVSLVNLVNYIWQPIIAYVEDLASGLKPKWTRELLCNHTALLLEMEGIVCAAADTMSIDDWIDFIRLTLVRFVGVDVPSNLIRQTFVHLVPFELEGTRANALHVLRSSLATKLVGPTLALQLGRQILQEVAELPVPLLSDMEVALGLKKDLVASLVQQHTSQAEGDAEEFPAKRLKTRTSQDRYAANTLSVEFALKNRLSWMRVGDIVKGAGKLIENLLSVGQDHRSVCNPSLEDILVGRWQLMRHTLLLDGAIDRCTSDKILEAREQNTFAGVGLATDESPPSQPRFLGLRFQITVMYMGRFSPQCTWEGRSEPPISRTSMLADIMHCSGKKGSDVSTVLDTQLARVGLNAYDVVGCTGISIYIYIYIYR